MPIKLHLVFRDRVGIVADLSRRIADRMFNIVSMEVDRVDDLAHVYVEVEHREADAAPTDLAQALADIPAERTRIIAFTAAATAVVWWLLATICAALGPRPGRS